MDMRYANFCRADSAFYDWPSPPGSMSWLAGTFMADRSVPDGWQLREIEGWNCLTPAESKLPAQGWKVHVSATMDNAAELLDAVWRYCVPRTIAFKFLPDRMSFLLRNDKYADRAGSGKFITVYPAEPGDLQRLLTELGAELDGQQGPYILSDLRWGSGPLHVRYGAFLRRYCRTADGEPVPAIADPVGRLVPDFRGPYFTIPPWVEIPGFLAPAVTARQDEEQAPNDFPYRVEQPLHFSNGGGVYLATDTRTGRRVVLREARPYAGLDAAGRDAVRRLERERDVLRKLSGTTVVPAIYDYFTCWEHHFLAEEYVEGETFGNAIAARFPLTRSEVTDAEVASYTRWALDVLDKVRDALAIMHQHGIVFGDLHPHNVMLRPDGQIRFIDLEVASYLGEQQRAVLGVPGYTPPDGRLGVAVDRYALACLRMAAFLPLTSLLPLDPNKATALATTITERFPVPPGFAAEILAELRPARAGEPGRVGALADALDTGRADWPALRASIRDAILTSASPDRADRLFPGDIQQFSGNGLGFAFGAAGVLHTLATTGAGRHAAHEQWLLDAVRRGATRDAVGFYDGLHGIAYTLDRLGRRDDALSVLELALDKPMDDVSANLFGGLPGIGLNLLHFGLRAHALEVADRLVDWADGPREHNADGRRRAGLLFGSAGRALFYLRLFEATGERQFLDLAESALRRDLDTTRSAEDGAVQIDEGWRLMPYLATGSVGLGFVLLEFLTHQDNDEFAAALAGIRRAAEPEFVIGSGLFNGRAGLITFLARLRDSEQFGLVDESVIERHVCRLAWHVIDYRGTVAFPGDQQLRLSMDLATGSAGILVALAATLDGNHGVLPFLSRRQGEEVTT